MPLGKVFHGFWVGFGSQLLFDGQSFNLLGGIAADLVDFWADVGETHLFHVHCPDHVND